MKKLLCILLIIGCMLSMFGCVSRQDDSHQQVTVYYRRSEPTYGAADSIIAPATLDASGHEKDYAYLIQEYLNGEQSTPFARTFPRSTQLISFKLEALTGKVVLSANFALLSGMDLTIACICLTQTIISLTDCQEVIISADHSLLDGNNFITLSRDSYLLLDDSGAGSSN